MTSDREAIWRDFIRQRGVNDPCERCRGLGTRCYGSTSTWYGGMGCAAMTTDVCDVCWGTGDKYRHGEDLRAARDGRDADVRRLALTWLAERAGVGLRSLNPAILELCNELDRFARGRKARPYGFDSVCMSLASGLRKAVADKE